MPDKKVRTSAMLDPEDYEWLKSMSDGVPFASLGHAIRTAVKRMRDEMDDDFSLRGEGEEE